MKTPEQIKAWLKAQPWNEQFKKEVMSGDDISDKSKKDILDGKRSINTLREGVVMFSAIDIMLHGQFIATLRMPLRPWPFTEDEVREFVLSKLPTLRGEDFKVAF